MTHELPSEIKRWTSQRRTALVLQPLRGETTANEAALFCPQEDQATKKT